MPNGRPLAVMWMLALGTLSVSAQLEALWEKSFDGGGLGDQRNDFVADLAVDAAGSIYVTGSSQGTNGTSEW